MDIASPIATSTPNSKVKRKHLTTVKENERITVLNINCRSIKNKIPDRHQIIQQVKPDIISCTETWLKPEVHTSEIFPNILNYQVFRDDRTTNQGGGVLIAISRDFICQEQPELKTNCNIQWVKMTIKGVKDIYVGSFYKPTENDENSLLELWSSLSKIPENSIIWLLGDFHMGRRKKSNFENKNIMSRPGSYRPRHWRERERGDFNLPCIDWRTESLKCSCKFKVMYEDFMDRIQNFNLQQMVTTPTRQENILDLFLTNTPSLVQNTETLPSLGTSDHDIVFH